MLTVKRKVDTEEDRYGGFDVSTTDNTFDIGYDFDINQSYSTAQTVKGETLNYSPRQEIEAPTDAPVKKRLRTEEFMPGIAKHKQQAQNNTQSQLSLRETMETRTKALLAVYMLVVLALAAIVIITGVAINAANSRVSSLASEIASKNAVIIEQTAQLELLNDEGFLKDSAYENGFVSAENPIEIDLLPVSEGTTYESNTNWFDKFCDFVSGVFGG